jgi:hypothetical protein
MSTVVITAIATADAIRAGVLVRGERLAYDLGVFGNRVKAVVAGVEDPVELEWPVTVWPRRRR